MILLKLMPLLIQAFQPPLTRTKVIAAAIIFVALVIGIGTGFITISEARVLAEINITTQEDSTMVKTFVSHKKVAATAMTRLDYNTLRGWNLPIDEDGSAEGYLVEYLDGGKSNHPDYTGYISWSPKAQFDNGYTEVVAQDRIDLRHIEAMLASLTFQCARIGDTTTTVCEAFLPNGFSVGSGKSACVNPHNFNYDLGCTYATENALADAKNNLWQLEGYLLKVTGKTSESF